MRKNPASAAPQDLVQRCFRAAAHRKRWVGDITYVATWAGFAHVAFVTDGYSRRIAGWPVLNTSELKNEASPLPALDMAAWSVGGDLSGLAHHSDHGSNYLSLRYADRVVELGARLPTGSVGDSYDNALAETVNDLFKTEPIYRHRPWRTVEAVELAKLERMSWWNTGRLHSELGYRTPVEIEAEHELRKQNPVAATADHENQ